MAMLGHPLADNLRYGYAAEEWKSQSESGGNWSADTRRCVASTEIPDLGAYI
jgi:hypothetical protein